MCKKAEFLKKKNFLKKHLFMVVYFYKKADFLQLFNCIKVGFLHKKAGFSKNIFLFLQLVYSCKKGGVLQAFT